MSAEELQRRAAEFPIDGYLTVGSPRRSSFTVGNERAAAFFWQPPGTQSVYLVRTQAPYIVRQLQRFFGASVDGKFGEQTRIAITNHARAAGLNVPQNWPVGGQLMGYALAQILGGGDVVFPSRVEFPDATRPALARSPNGRESTYIGALDLSTGREAPLPTVQAQPAQPAAPATPAQPGTEHSLVAPGAASTPPPAAPGNASMLDAAVAMLPAGFQPVVDALGNQYVMFEGTLFQFAPQANFNAVVSPFGGLVADAPGNGGCPKSFVDADGRCKLVGYGRAAGARMAIPNDAGIVVDFANPQTYRNADRSPAVFAVGFAALGGVAVEMVRRW